MRIKFWCPCGKTDFSHIVNPSPDCLANRHSDPQNFPTIDMESSEDKRVAKKFLDMELSEKTRHLKRNFSLFGAAVLSYAKQVPDVTYFMRDNLSFYGQPANNDFYDLYAKFREGADFINFDILRSCLDLLIIFDTAEENELRISAIQAAERYEYFFQDYAKHRVFNVPVLQPNQDGHSTLPEKELKMKIEEDAQTFSVERLFYFKKKVREILNLPSEVSLQVITVKKGCVEIVFKVIGSFSDDIFDVNTAQKKKLLAENITLLEYTSRTSYCCCQILEDEVCKWASVCMSLI